LPGTVLGKLLSSSIYLGSAPSGRWGTLMSVVNWGRATNCNKYPSPPPARAAGALVSNWVHRANGEGLRRRLIILLFACRIPHRPLFVWGFPCLPASIGCHRPPNKPAVATTAIAREIAAAFRVSPRDKCLTTGLPQTGSFTHSSEPPHRL
jgi:hypothetical protein